MSGSATTFPRIITGDQHIGAHVPPEWVVDGIVQRGRLYSCTSLTAHGKTAVALYLACMIHAARKKAGTLDVGEGNVLYLAGENPDDLAARMLGMAIHFSIPSLRMPYVLPQAFPLNDAEADALIDEIAKLGVDFALIIGDTAASFFAFEDENSNTDQGDQARIWRKLTMVSGRPAVMPLCHPVKNALKDNLLPRGGGAFLNELDGNLTLWSDLLGEQTTLHWQGKIRGPDFVPLEFKLLPVPTGLIDAKGREEMTIIAIPIDDVEAADRTRQAVANEDSVLRVLHDHPDWSMRQIATDLGWLSPKGLAEGFRVTRCLQAMAKDKLVQKTRSKGNWEVTPKGLQALQARWPTQFP